MSTLTWRQYGDLSSPRTWSPSQSPRPGDTLIQNQGASYALNEDLSANTLYLGSTDQNRPAVLYTVNATVKVDTGAQLGDNQFGTRYATIGAYGGQDRILLDETSERGHSNSSIYADQGTQLQVIGSITHSALSVSGPGVLTGESISEVNQASVTITSDMIGTGSMTLDNSSAELGGRVGAYQGITFVHTGNSLVVDHADEFFGTIDMSEAPGGAQISLNGIEADWAGFWGDRLYLWGGGKLEQIALQPGSAGFDVYKTPKGALIGPYDSSGTYKPPAGDSLILHQPGAATS